MIKLEKKIVFICNKARTFLNKVITETLWQVDKLFKQYIPKSGYETKLLKPMHNSWPSFWKVIKENAFQEYRKIA